jgi:hypothetical protein
MWCEGDFGRNSSAPTPTTMMHVGVVILYGGILIVTFGARTLMKTLYSIGLSVTTVPSVVTLLRASPWSFCYLWSCLDIIGRQVRILSLCTFIPGVCHYRQPSIFYTCLSHHHSRSSLSADRIHAPRAGVRGHMTLSNIILGCAVWRCLVVSQGSAMSPLVGSLGWFLWGVVALVFLYL